MKLICLQSSILSQGTVGCQEFLIYLGVDTITLSVSDTTLPHFKKKKKRSGGRKKDTHASSNSDLLAHMLEGDDLLQLLPFHKLSNRLTRCTQLLPCAAGTQLLPLAVSQIQAVLDHV